jgi:hypothetical protein
VRTALPYLHEDCILYNTRTAPRTNNSVSNLRFWGDAESDLLGAGAVHSWCLWDSLEDSQRLRLRARPRKLGSIQGPKSTSISCRYGLSLSDNNHSSFLPCPCPVIQVRRTRHSVSFIPSLTSPEEVARERMTLFPLKQNSVFERLLARYTYMYSTCVCHIGLVLTYEMHPELVRLAVMRNVCSPRGSG